MKGCSRVLLRGPSLGETEKGHESTAGLSLSLVVHNVAVIPNKSVSMKQSGRTHASIGIVALYVADKCHAIS
jgi:hypothetical protein